VSPLVRGLTVTELPLTASDEANGVARRWKVSGPNTLRYVMLTRPGKGAWAAPAKLLCSCDSDVFTEGVVTGCAHIEACRELLAPPPRVA